MKSIYTYAIALLASLTIGLTLLLAQAANAASSATLSLDPATASYTVGSTFTATVHENSQSTPINAVEADLTYNQSDLQFVSIGPAGPFDVDAASTGGSGSITIARAKLETSFTGDQAVASITFKVLANSGSSAVNFAPSSAVVQTSDHQSIWDANPNGGTYSYTATGTVVQSSSPATASQNSVAIKAVSSGNQAVNSATVSIDGSAPVSTDATGVASFPNVAPGQHTVTVTANGKTTSQSITVKPQTPKALQQFNVLLATAHSKTTIAWYIAGLLVALAAAVAVVRLLHRPPTIGITPSASATEPTKDE